MNPQITKSFLLIALVIGITNCGSDGTGPDTGGNSVSISKTSVTLNFLGETTQLTATVRNSKNVPVSGQVTWSSDAPTVATVSSNGLVTAIGNGQATLTATSGSLSATSSATVQQVPTSLSVISGNAQTDTVGQLLTEPLVVRAEDQGGTTVSAVSISFSISQGGGSLSETSVTSDGDGEASTTWTLGTTSGTQNVAATIQGSESGKTDFSATATPGPATAFSKEWGDQQIGKNNRPLPEPIKAAVKDEFGNGIAGIPVTLAVTDGGGSISPADSVTGETGTAEGIWTMGIVGTNTLTASTAGFPDLEFTATAELYVAKADLTVTSMTVSPANATAFQDLTVTATITNSGDFTTGSAFDVQLLLDNIQTGNTTVSELADSAETQISFNVGRLASGPHTFQVVIDPNNDIDEHDEANNSVGRNAPIAAATELVAGTPARNLSLPDSMELLFNLELPSSSNLVISTSGGSGDLDLYVHHGARPAHRDDYKCQSGSPISSESCTFNAAEPGVYHILLFAWDQFSSVTLEAQVGGDPNPFNIELVFLNSGTTEQDDAFRTSAAKWESIITDDIYAFSFADNPASANECVSGQPMISDVVDDVRIYISIRDIDGPQPILGRAGPCYIRGLSEHPIVGMMEFDIYDFDRITDQGLLIPVVLHEMGHVLGIGTIWDRKELLVNPSAVTPSADTHFIGPLAITAFDNAGGVNYTGGQKVPVENEAGPGSQDSHWREAVFNAELMSPFVDSGVQNPLSRITIQSLADLGYGVDATQDEPYSVPLAADLVSPDRGPGIDLRDDIRIGPILVVGPKKRRR
ncbi:MAG: hypothetical protein CME14_05975 [Gemmatimonadetes bacterium]|nr:hypothetical protein [Gemmatimonadota bacterium]